MIPTLPSGAVSPESSKRSGIESLQKILWKALTSFYSIEECLVYKALESAEEAQSIAQIAQAMRCEPFTNENITVSTALVELKDFVEHSKRMQNVTMMLYEQGLDHTEESQKWVINYKKAAETVFARAIRVFYQWTSHTEQKSSAAHVPTSNEDDSNLSCAVCSVSILPHEIPSLEIDDETGEFVCPVCPDGDNGEKVLLKHGQSEAGMDIETHTVSLDQELDADRILEIIQSRKREAFVAELGPVIDILRLYVETGPFYFSEKESLQSVPSLVFSRAEYEQKQQLLQDAKRKPCFNEASQHAYEDFRLQGTHSSVLESEVPENDEEDEPIWMRATSNPEENPSDEPERKIIFNFSANFDGLSAVQHELV